MRRVSFLKRSQSRASNHVCRSEPSPQPPSDWRTFRNALVKQEVSEKQATAGIPSDENVAVFRYQNPQLAAEELWAHALNAVEPGCLVVASQQCPRILGDERLWQVVIFITQHSAAGSVGLVLNRPIGIGVKDILQAAFLPVESTIASQGAFDEQPCYFGGSIAVSTLSILHGYAELAGANAVGDTGVYTGALRDSLQGAVLHDCEPAGFRFFLGTMRWGPGELEQQVDKGAWILAAASRAVVLKPCLRLPVPLWKEVLRLMGGEFVDIAGDPKPSNLL